MYRVLRVTALAVLFLGLMAISAAPADDADDVWAAQQAALDWLALADNGQYAESWNAADPQLRQKVSEAAWNMSMRWTRSPLSAVIQRDIGSSEIVHPVPGKPAGDYVVLQYNTAFEYKAEGQETVTCVRGPDNVWRVAGYVIH